jgi:hypothetical protein
LIPLARLTTLINLIRLGRLAVALRFEKTDQASVDAAVRPRPQSNNVLARFALGMFIERKAASFIRG